MSKKRKVTEAEWNRLDTLLSVYVIASNGAQRCAEAGEDDGFREWLDRADEARRGIIDMLEGR